MPIIPALFVIYPKKQRVNHQSFAVNHLKELYVLFDVEVSEKRLYFADKLKYLNNDLK